MQIIKLLFMVMFVIMITSCSNDASSTSYIQDESFQNQSSITAGMTTAEMEKYNSYKLKQPQSIAPSAGKIVDGEFVYDGELSNGLFYGDAVFQGINGDRTNWNFYSICGLQGDVVTIEVHRLTTAMDPIVALYGSPDYHKIEDPTDIHFWYNNNPNIDWLTSADDNLFPPHFIGQYHGRYYDSKIEDYELPYNGLFTIVTTGYYGLGPGPTVPFDIHISGFSGGQCVSINEPPVADAGDDQSVECSGNSSATVTLDGTGSSDPDGDNLTYEWFADGSLIGLGSLADVNLPLGVTSITLVVNDGNDATASDDVIIEVVDNTDPTVDFTIGTDQLWPPNHEMQLVAENITAADGCCDVTLAVDVTSNEGVNGNGDGDMAPDWEIIDNGDGSFNVWVRAERSGNGEGRVYTISAIATDCAGNQSEETGTVTVPHSKRKK